MLLINSESADACAVAAAAATAAAAGSSHGAFDMIIGTSVLQSLIDGAAAAAVSFLQRDVVATLHLQYPPWLRCTLQGCCITLSGSLQLAAPPTQAHHAAQAWRQTPKSGCTPWRTQWAHASQGIPTPPFPPFPVLSSPIPPPTQAI